MRVSLRVVVAVAGVVSCGGQAAPPPQPPAQTSVLDQPGAAPTDTPATSDAGVASVPDAAPPADTPPAGQPVTVLVKDLHSPNALAVDKSSIYWVDELDGDLARVPKRGGVTMTVYAGNGSPFSLASSITVDDTDVYWTSQIDRTSTLSRQD